MQAKINYLFDSGASGKPLPVGNKMSAAIKAMIEEVADPAHKSSENDCMPDSDRPWERFRQEVIADLQWLYEKTEGHVSIKTFARKFYSQHQPEEVTKLRSVFFMFQTMIRFEEPYD